MIIFRVAEHWLIWAATWLLGLLADIFGRCFSRLASHQLIITVLSNFIFNQKHNYLLKMIATLPSVSSSLSQECLQRH